MVQIDSRNKSVAEVVSTSGTKYTNAIHNGGGRLYVFAFCSTSGRKTL